MVTTIQLNLYQAIAVAAVLFWIGNLITDSMAILKRYCIPSPLVGGLVFATLNTALYATGLPYITFDSTLQTLFMNMFFTSVGFSVSLPLLKKGGKAVVRLLALSTVLTLLQNFLGAGVLYGMGQDPRLGLAVGSISLIGGPGTAAAMGPDLEAAGCAGGTVVGLAAATFGLVVGSLMGGPIARKLILKNGLGYECDCDREYEGQTFNATPKGFLTAFMLILFCVGIGSWVSIILNALTPVTWPGYIGAMMVAVVVRNMMPGEYPEDEVETLGSMCLSIFLALAMMGLKLWELADLAFPLIVTLSAQIVLIYLFSKFVVFKAMGGSYESAIMTAGLIGYGMGATSSAMANMEAITKQYGPAPSAYFVVPIVGGMFIDFVNVVVVAAMIPLLGQFV